MSYSQNKEDLLIAEYFGDFKGSLLSIGENNGLDLSNSRLLIEKGWVGTLVEPSPAFVKLEVLYKDNPNVCLVKKAISNFSGQAVWYEVVDSLLSTMEIELAEHWGRPYETTTVEVQHVSELLPGQYDFISIDTEGNDWTILQQIDLTNVRCLCIEHGNDDATKTAMLNYCNGFGMKVLLMNFENYIFVK